eukprot:scaffold50327_cov50-Attheya_sp.AAC.2
MGSIDASYSCGSNPGRFIGIGRLAGGREVEISRHEELGKSNRSKSSYSTLPVYLSHLPETSEANY